MFMLKKPYAITAEESRLIMVIRQVRYRIIDTGVLEHDFKYFNIEREAAHHLEILKSMDKQNGKKYTPPTAALLTMDLNQEECDLIYCLRAIATHQHNKAALYDLTQKYFDKLMEIELIREGVSHTEYIKANTSLFDLECFSAE